MMKARKLLFGAVAIAAAATATLVACNKNIQRETNANRALTAGVLAVCDCANTITKDSTLTGQISSDLFLRAAVRYKLSGLVFVVGNHTLTIEKGTRIEGIKGTGGAVGGGLIITKGSKIVAEGSASCPIVFTSDQASPASGDWAGVVILGKAQTNNAPAFVEGINNTSYPGVDLQYGSTDSIVSSVNVNNDSSGRLRFVRIEYGGYALSTDNEINGLTLAGVGRKTVIDYVEVYKANDDAFEFFGGTVNATHILSIDALDDMFDTDNGYTGTISFALGLADTSRKDQSQSNGFESDNNAGGTVATGAPVTEPTYNNVTIVGVPSIAKARKIDTVTVGGTTYQLRYGRAGHFRRNSRFHLNGVIAFGYDFGISIDQQLLNGTSNSLVEYNAGRSSLANVYSAGFNALLATTTVPAWSVESNGVAASGSNFTSQYSVVSGNVAGSSSSTNPFNLSSPFSRSAITNFIPTVGQASRAYGAFPNGTNWTNPDGCSVNNWIKLSGL